MGDINVMTGKPCADIYVKGWLEGLKVTNIIPMFHKNGYLPTHIKTLDLCEAIGDPLNTFFVKKSLSKLYSLVLKTKTL